MKVTLQSTEFITVIIDHKKHTRTPARLWVGETDKGIPVQALIPCIAVLHDKDQEEFQRDLLERSAPAPEAPAFPPRASM